MTTLVRHAVDNADPRHIVYGQANAAALEICKQANHHPEIDGHYLSRYWAIARRSG